METHEWREKTDEGVRYWRARRDRDSWQFQTTLKHEPDWEPIDPPPRELWESFREVLWRKYQRRRIPWKHIERIDRMLEDDELSP